MPVRKPFFNDAGIQNEMPVTDTIRVAEPAGAGQPMIWEQGGASNYFVGQWVSCKLSFSGNSVTAYAANTLFAFPLRIRSSVTFNQISSVVTTLAAGGLYRIGIYRDTGSVYPGALVTGTDTGAYSSAAVGNPIGAVTFTLTPGLYWIAFLTNNITSAFRSIPTNAIPNILGEIGSNFTANSSVTSYSLTGFAFASLPTNFPALASFTVAVTPLVGLRVSAVP
jgi:hypothetical protein